MNAHISEMGNEADELAAPAESLPGAVDRFTLEQDGAAAPESNGMDLALSNGSANGHVLPAPEGESVVSIR